ncbi:MAG: dihydrodipicolinate synthase family protein [Verrucomicrobiales bacterium]|nr:dihydrodipicolinate synthase family protein [Verrucomicrobiales bacterium]
MNSPLPALVRRLRDGLVIPAHPLALNRARKLDVRRQRALTRYYLAAGAGGLAVGVHTTQFAIRDPRHGLLRPVLELASATARECSSSKGQPGSKSRPVLIAGVCGPTRQAVAEATLARELGYDAGLLSLGALRDATERQLIDHCRAVAREIPVIGFYLQPAAGGRLLAQSFWRRLVEIPQVIAIKIAPFNRYQTLDVLRAVAESGRAKDIALYTGNDDHILADLVTAFEFATDRARKIRLRIAGGLLGQWACWTRTAVDHLDQAKAVRESKSVPASFLTLSEQLTDANGAIFDVANGFAGCIAGIHHVLARQGLLAGTWCLDPNERLGPGQAREIDRVTRAYPHLTDDAFVRRHLDDWLRD